MDKIYNFKEVEDEINTLWQDSGVFSPEYENSEYKSDTKMHNVFAVVIPPPNVTGVLHMGHGLNNVIQDVVVRYKRMKGFVTVWVPGCDHAGIATQQIMEQRLAGQGKTRYDLGREEFVRKTMELSEEHKRIILRQLRTLGSSCDWTRECFTLDENLSKAVREAFISLYEHKLIYRGDYLVNWSVGAGTALSDDEVEYKEVQGSLYRIFYPFEDGQSGLEIATTRPETMFGDTAVAVHPDDARYKHAAGRHVKLPLTDRIIPVVADEYVKSEFGTGAVKITPAHDYNDYELGKRHNLECINILHRNGTLNENVPKAYRGLSVSQARAQIVKDLQERGNLKNATAHIHSVGHCYRTGTAIEPMLSTQWFVKMDVMAQKALAAWKEGAVRFYPRHWENTFVHWLSTIKDWCISRQLWWGHRIPVWYDDARKEVLVLREDPSPEEIKSRNLRQDTDVLDTWFSSWLWPFAVFGWPEKTADLQKFYPTSVVVTAYDIIFFWVARMVMAGLEFMGEVPFKDIYIHGLIRDDKGQKMSKSLGNGIDPLVIAEKDGADALKFTLTFLCKLGTDVLLNEESFQFGSRFANKVWNASRFVLMNIEHIAPDENITNAQHLPPEDSLNDIDKWIIHRLSITAKNINQAVDAYRLDEAAKHAYEYFWQDFCDWYIEASKTFLVSDNFSQQRRAAGVLLWVLRENIKLLHPFVPFVTEKIYQHIQKAAASKYPLAGQPYPCIESSWSACEAPFAALKKLVSGVRTIRSEFGIVAKQMVRFSVYAENAEIGSYFAQYKKLIASLTKADMSLYFADIISAPADEKRGINIEGAGFSASVFIQDSINIDAEKKRLRGKLEKLAKQRNVLQMQLSSKKFMEKASSDYVEQVKSEDSALQESIKKTKSFLDNLNLPA